MTFTEAIAEVVLPIIRKEPIPFMELLRRVQLVEQFKDLHYRDLDAALRRLRVDGVIKSVRMKGKGLKTIPHWKMIEEEQTNGQVG